MKQQLKPVTLFLSYAHEDELLCKELVKHLSLLRRQGFISTWHNRQIVAGTNWMEVIDGQLEQASIILLLVSSDFLASDYCYQVEMQRALERHKVGQVRVIPIILRPCDWRETPFAKLQCLPDNGKPITTWNNQDEAFGCITQTIREVIVGRTSSVSPSRSRRDKVVSPEEAEKSQGAKMRIKRQKKGISLTELAKSLGYTKGYLSTVETSRILPPPMLIKQYEKALLLQPGELIDVPETNKQQTRSTQPVSTDVADTW